MPRSISALRLSVAGLICLAVAMGIGRFAFTPLLPMMREEGLVSVADGGNLALAHFPATCSAQCLLQGCRFRRVPLSSPRC